MTFLSPARKAHSTLYHLEPIGAGTPFVESLTGYIARLAREHCLPVHLLVGEIIVPELRVTMKSRSYSQFFKESACSINGLGQYAEDFHSALERLTLRQDLFQLMMLPWNKVFDPGGKGLNKPLKAWCSSCFREWFKNGAPLYEPLIWTLSSVRICGRHESPLRTTCSGCGEPQPVLGRTYPIGYCSSCGEQLWSKEDKKFEGEEYVTEWDLWVVTEVGRLLSASPSESGMATQKRFQSAVADVVRHLKVNNTQELDRSIGFGESTITQWRRGRGKPRFDYFLLFCFKTNIVPKDMLCLSSEEFLRNSRRPGNKEKISLKKASHKHEELRKRVKKEMEILFSTEDAPSLKEFARDAGVGLGYMRYRFPEESKRIAGRYRESLRERKESLFHERSEAIRMAVEDLRRSDEHPSKWKVFRRIPGILPGGGKDKDLTRVWKDLVVNSYQPAESQESDYEKTIEFE